jgi:hypothetical protein
VTSHPENAIVIPKWKGEAGDKGLVAMIPFLECKNVQSVIIIGVFSTLFKAIAIYKPPDVRPILEPYRGKDIPAAYAENEAAAKRKYIEEWSRSNKGLSEGGFTLSKLFVSSGSVCIFLRLFLVNVTNYDHRTQIFPRRIWNKSDARRSRYIMKSRRILQRISRTLNGCWKRKDR